MAEMADLTLHSEITVGGRTLRLEPIRFGQVDDLWPLMERCFDGLELDKFDNHQQRLTIAITKGILKNREYVVSFLSAYSGETEDWISSLTVDDAVSFFGTVVRMNQTFLSLVLADRLVLMAGSGPSAPSQGGTVGKKSGR